jgi:hypothetical protein
MRTLIAFLVAPLATMLPAVAAPPLWGLFAVLTFYAYLLLLIIGIPGFRYFRRKGWTSLWQAVIAGAAVGLAFPTLMLLSFGVSSSDLGSPEFLSTTLGLPLMGAVLGAAVALVFWRIAMASSPNSESPRHAA